MNTNNRLFFVSFMILSVFVVTSLTAQTQWTHPVRLGNYFVYRLVGVPNLKPTIFRSYVSKDLYNFLESDTLLLAADYSMGPFLKHPRSEVKVNSRGILYSIWEYKELYPLIPPNTDSLYLFGFDNSSNVIDSSLYIVRRRFDTTLFSINVKAFIISLPGVIEFTIADRFGTIREVINDQQRSDTLLLHSCFIDGNGYNWENRKWNYMPLCIGNVYQYREYEFGFKYHTDTYKILQDSSYMGKKYYGKTLLGWLREDEDGLHQLLLNGKERLLFPSNATIGTPIILHLNEARVWFVMDTGTTRLNLQLKRALKLEKFYGLDEDSHDLVWYEGPGVMYKSDVLAMYGNLELRYYSVCGDQYGSLDSYNEVSAKSSESILLYQNSPNPFSSSTTISYKLPHNNHVRLEVFDMLGRRVASLVDEQKDAGEFRVIFEPRASHFELHPGVYFYRLTTSSASITKCMMVVK